MMVLWVAGKYFACNKFILVPGIFIYVKWPVFVFIFEKVAHS
jgi:hypothetical protein